MVLVSSSVCRNVPSRRQFLPCGFQLTLRCCRQCCTQTHHFLCLLWSNLQSSWHVTCSSGLEDWTSRRSHMAPWVGTAQKGVKEEMTGKECCLQPYTTGHRFPQRVRWPLVAFVRLDKALSQPFLRGNKPQTLMYSLWDTNHEDCLQH
jgi:hypothetical protein